MGLNNLQTGGTGGISPGGLRNLTEISAIPDSVDDNWPVTETSGSVLSNDLRDIQIDLFNSPSFNNDSFGNYVDLDSSSSEHALSENTSLGYDGSDYGVGMWVEIVGTTNFAGLIKEDTDPSGGPPSDGFIVDDDGSGSLRFRHRNGGSTNSIGTWSYSTNTIYFITISSDTNDNTQVRIWDKSTQVKSIDGTATKGNGNERLLINGNNNNYFDLNLYDIYSAGGFVSEADWKSIWDVTKGGL